MQATGDTLTRPSTRPAHRPVEKGTAGGKIRISCGGPRCGGWDPRPCDTRREAQYWYDKHVAQPLTHQLW